MTRIPQEPSDAMRAHLLKSYSYDPETGDIYGPKGHPLHAKQTGGYIKVLARHNGERFFSLAHRMAWFLTYGYFPIELDHINQIKTDNRLCNLREIEHSDNLRNVTWCKRKNTYSDYRGVAFRPGKRRKTPWTARISMNDHTYYLGSFATEIAAALHYNLFAKFYFGEFAYQNDIKPTKDNDNDQTEDNDRDGNDRSNP